MVYDVLTEMNIGKVTSMKILMVGNYFYPEHTGGVEIVSYNLVTHYRNFGHTVRWMAADVPPRYREIQKDDVPIRAWNYTEEKLGFPSPLPFPNSIFKLYMNIKWSDVIHLQDCLYPINVMVFFLSKILGKPILITQYAKFIPYKQLYKRALQALAYHSIGSLMFSSADCVVFITSNVRDNMQYLNPKKMMDVVPLGVDTDFYSPLLESERSELREKLIGNSSTPIILFVGRMVERKGVNLICPLIEKHKEWHWILVGRPDDFNPANWQASNLTYFKNASEEELKELYASADLLVHPSIGEGVTLVVSESLSSGTPVIISQESLYEVDEKHRSLFFAVQPNSTDIEESIAHALADRRKLENLRRSCREYARNRLSWKKMTEKYLVILGELLR